MTESPERIWAFASHIAAIWQTVPSIRGDTTEYIRADLVPGWSTDMEAAPKDGTLHLRGLWVYSVETGKPLYWQVDAGGYDEGNFVGSNGDDFGWSADDYTHWMPLPASPKGES